jgi:hypothetical protein
MKNKLIATSMLLAFSISAFAFPLPPDQPFMRAAYENLKDAKNSLLKATADKGGHRQRAIDLTNAAMTSVSNGIAYDQQNYTPGRRRPNSVESEFEMPPMPDQPNMVKAREHLNAAMANLRKASADNVQSAINAVNDGIEYDRTH